MELDRATVVARDHAIDTVVALMRGSMTLHQHAETSPDAKAMTGRGVSWAFDVGDERWVVRHYRRGGAVARVLRDRYLRGGATRPERELAASVAARAKGVATPEVVAYAVYPAGPYYRADLATRWVEDSEDLGGVTFGADTRSVAERAAAWAAAGRLLRTTFDAGVRHPDLNLRNVLIAGDAAAPDAWLLDLDRATVTGRLPDAARAAMIERFDRSRRKLERRFGRRVDEDCLAAFREALDG